MFDLRCIEKVSDWDPALAETIRKEVEAEVESEAGVSLDAWKRYWDLVVAEGYDGPSAVDGVTDFAKAREVVSAVVAGVSFRDYKYENPERESECLATCGVCGSESVSTPNGVDYYCNDCDDFVDATVEWLPNTVLTSEEIRREMFREYFKIYGG